MARVIMVCGKGGVGKTTVAAATAWMAARKGHRTVVLSFDLAHSLADAFDLDRTLFNQARGAPRPVADGLDLQEIDVQEDLTRHWGEIYEYTALFMSSTGLSDLVAEELAVFPGLSDIIALMYIKQYVDRGAYDVIVVDCPPTAEALRFVAVTSTLDWYVRKRLKTDKALLRLARPLLEKVSDAPVPSDGYLTAIERLVAHLRGVEEILLNPEVTTVRLVTNAERMVVRETQRAYMYFNMYGMVTDKVVINRLLPDGSGYFAQWAQTQAHYAAEIRSYFDPVPVDALPLFEDEIVGAPRIAKLGEALYGDSDPAGRFVDGRPYELAKHDGTYTLSVRLPFIEKADVKLSRTHDDEDLVIRVGGFTRHVTLPRAMLRLKTAGARFEHGVLNILFVKESGA